MAWAAAIWEETENERGLAGDRITGMRVFEC